MHAKMHAIPVPHSISQKVYQPFEYLSGDYIPFSGGATIRGYTGAVVYVDRATGKLFIYFVKSKDEWLQTLKDCIRENGPGRNTRSVHLRFLLTDYASEVHSTEFTAFLQQENIQLNNSAPYKHEQNLVERFIQILWNMTRANMFYNSAPLQFLCYALRYTVDTYNMLCKKGNLMSRNEEFTSVKSDVSLCVPFYATGWAYLSIAERLALKLGKGLKPKAKDVIMLGYCMPYEIPDKSKSVVFIKNSYICYSIKDNTVQPRHDCYFLNYPVENDLFNSEVKKCNLEGDFKSSGEIPDYDSIFGPVIDPDSWSSKIKNTQFICKIENTLPSCIQKLTRILIVRLS
jgi:hypothetical protein